MKHRAHIVESQSAINEGSEQRALCGEPIKRAKLVALGDGELLPGDRTNSSVPRGVCSQCAKVRTFRYLIQEATEDV